MGPVWNHFGTILGPCWYHFWTIFGPCWNHFWTIWGPFWIILGSFPRLICHPPSQGGRRQERSLKIITQMPYVQSPPRRFARERACSSEKSSNMVFLSSYKLSGGLHLGKGGRSSQRGPGGSLGGSPPKSSKIRPQGHREKAIQKYHQKKSSPKSSCQKSRQRKSSRQTVRQRKSSPQ